MTRSTPTDGERWTREQLATLLARRFSPSAVGAFLVASQRRANAIRAQRPELARQEARWLTLGALAYVPLAPSRRGALLWWAVVAAMVDWHLGMLESEDGEPRLLGPADALTLSRVWMAPLAWRAPSAALVALAGATDVADGRVARATGATTRAGRDLEGLADTTFALAALRGAVRTGALPRAVVGAEAARLTVGFAYALGVYFGTAERPDPLVLRAARATTPVRAGGLLAGALGRRRVGASLLAAGSAASVGAVLLAAARRGPGYSKAAGSPSSAGSSGTSSS